jgi:DNA-binding GntR family transcriptional regulator
LSYLLQNADPDTVQAFSHYSRAELAQYEHLYRVRQRVSGSAGRYAGDTAYGAQIDRLERELRAIHHELRHRHPQQTGKAAGKALTGAARTGARNAK